MSEDDKDYYLRHARMPSFLDSKEAESWFDVLLREMRNASTGERSVECAASFLAHYNNAIENGWRAQVDEMRKNDIDWQEAIKKRRHALEAEEKHVESLRRKWNDEQRAWNEERRALHEERRALREEREAFEGTVDDRQSPNATEAPTESKSAPEQATKGRPDDGSWEWAVAQLYWRFDRRALVSVFWVVVALVFIVWLLSSNSPIDYFGR